LAVWWFASAAAVIWALWIKPASDKRKAELAEKRRKEAEAAEIGPFSRGDEADYVIVSPYEPVDSEKRPWWKPRRQ
jgi:hypothetical protein